MKCLLCDINPAMREAWKEELGRRPRLDALCSVVAGDITGLKADAAVSPANSSHARRSGRRLYTCFRGGGGKPAAGDHPYASRRGIAGRGSASRAYRPYGHPVADFRADHAEPVRSPQRRPRGALGAGRHAGCAGTIICVHSFSGHGYGDGPFAVRCGGEGHV